MTDEQSNAFFLKLLLPTRQRIYDVTLVPFLYDMVSRLMSQNLILFF